MITRRNPHREPGWPVYVCDGVSGQAAAERAKCIGGIQKDEVGEFLDLDLAQPVETVGRAEIRIIADRGEVDFDFRALIGVKQRTSPSQIGFAMVAIPGIRHLRDRGRDDRAGDLWPRFIDARIGNDGAQRIAFADLYRPSLSSARLSARVQPQGDCPVDDNFALVACYRIVPARCFATRRYPADLARGVIGGRRSGGSGVEQNRFRAAKHHNIHTLDLQIAIRR